jgi:hypothetical protein
VRHTEHSGRRLRTRRNDRSQCWQRPRRPAPCCARRDRQPAARGSSRTRTAGQAAAGAGPRSTRSTSRKYASTRSRKTRLNRSSIPHPHSLVEHTFEKLVGTSDNRNHDRADQACCEPYVPGPTTTRETSKIMISFAHVAAPGRSRTPIDAMNSTGPTFPSAKMSALSSSRAWRVHRHTEVSDVRAGISVPRSQEGRPPLSNWQLEVRCSADEQRSGVTVDVDGGPCTSR